MKILAIEREISGIGDEEFTPELLRAEAECAWRLYQDGVVRELYFRPDWPGAVLMLECDTASEASRQLGHLPLVAAGLIKFEIIPLEAYHGFARLFTTL